MSDHNWPAHECALCGCPRAGRHEQDPHPEAPAPDLVALVDAYGEAVGALHSWGGAPREARASAAKAARLAAISRALSEARREAAEEALRVVAECADREGLLNDDEAIICGGEVFDRIRALASTTRGDAR